MRQSMQQSATLSGGPAARRRAPGRAPRLVGLLALVLLVLSLALPAGAAASAAPPMISGFTPSVGHVGTAVTVTGSGFSGATVVEFVHAEASFTVVSDSRITLTVPAAAVSGPISVTTWAGTATSAADFVVTPTLAVTAPTGSASYAQGDNLTVSWTASGGRAIGEFGVWVRVYGNTWYLETLVPGTSSSSYTTALTLDVPAGSGYQAIVAWRPTAGSGEWMTWGTSSGSFSVTASAPPVITVTAPWGSGASYGPGNLLTVNWTTSRATATGEFCVWVRSSGGGWYIAKLWPAGGGTSFGTFLVLDVPAGNGYQAIVAWRPTAGSGAWVSWGTSPGSFAVTAQVYTITSSVTRHIRKLGISPRGYGTGTISPLGAQLASIFHEHLRVRP